MTTPLDQLKACRDIRSVRPALYSLCERFGSVARLEVVAADQAGHHQALCFWRMQTPEEERRLMRALGVGRFGGELVTVVDLDSPAEDM